MFYVEPKKSINILLDGLREHHSMKTPSSAENESKKKQHSTIPKKKTGSNAYHLTFEVRNYHVMYLI